jgi:hypothetical protein
MVLLQVGLRGVPAIWSGMVYGTGTHGIVPHPVQP